MSYGRGFIAKLKSSKFTRVVYMVYVLRFPDGDEWVRERPMSAHDLAFEIRQMILQHKKSSTEWKKRADALWMVGECWWKDSLGVENLIFVSGKPQPKHRLKWGVSKKGFMQVEYGVDENGKKPGGNT